MADCNAEITKAIFRRLVGDKEAFAAFELNAVVDVAKANHVLLELTASFAKSEEHVPAVLLAAAEAERVRVGRLQDVRECLVRNSEKEGVRLCFLKTKPGTLDHGGDIDLLVFTRDVAVDESLLAGMEVTRRKMGLRSSFGRRAEYETVDGVQVEILHAAVGRFSQLSALVPVLERASQQEPETVPSEYQLICCVALRLYDQATVRLIDMVFSIRAIEHCNPLRLMELATDLGLAPGLRFFFALIRDFWVASGATGPVPACVSAAARGGVVPFNYVPGLSFSREGTRSLLGLQIKRAYHQVSADRWTSAILTTVHALSVSFTARGRRF